MIMLDFPQQILGNLIGRRRALTESPRVHAKIFLTMNLLFISALLSSGNAFKFFDQFGIILSTYSNSDVYYSAYVQNLNGEYAGNLTVREGEPMSNSISNFELYDHLCTSDCVIQLAEWEENHLLIYTHAAASGTWVLCTQSSDCIDPVYFSTPSSCTMQPAYGSKEYYELLVTDFDGNRVYPFSVEYPSNGIQYQLSFSTDPNVPNKYDVISTNVKCH